MVVNVSQAIRADLVKHLVDAGLDSTISYEIIDLAAHAVDQAIETTLATCRRASTPQVMMTALPLAYSLLSAAATVHGNAADQAAKRLADKLGLKTVILTSTGEG